MVSQGVSFEFPEGATDHDKVTILCDYPYSFARWCRSKVGLAPGCKDNNGHGCTMEEYIEEMTGSFWVVDQLYIVLRGQQAEALLTPIWVCKVLDYVDCGVGRATYLDVANFVVGALNRGEIA